MTLVAQRPGFDSAGDVSGGVTHEGHRGEYRHDRLFGLFDSFVGEMPERPLALSLGSVMLSKETASDEGIIRAITELPTHARRDDNEDLLHRTQVRFTETVDGDVFAEKDTVAISASGQTLRIEHVDPLDSDDHGLLDVLEKLLAEQ